MIRMENTFALKNKKYNVYFVYDGTSDTVVSNKPSYIYYTNLNDNILTNNRLLLLSTFRKTWNLPFTKKEQLMSRSIQWKSIDSQLGYITLFSEPCGLVEKDGTFQVSIDLKSQAEKDSTIWVKEYPTDEYPTDEYPTDKYPTDEYPTDKYPTDEYPTSSITEDYTTFIKQYQDYLKEDMLEVLSKEMIDLSSVREVTNLKVTKKLGDVNTILDKITQVVTYLTSVDKDLTLVKENKADLDNRWSQVQKRKDQVPRSLNLILEGEQDFHSIQKFVQSYLEHVTLLLALGKEVGVLDSSLNVIFNDKLSATEVFKLLTESDCKLLSTYSDYTGKIEKVIAKSFPDSSLKVDEDNSKELKEMKLKIQAELTKLQSLFVQYSNVVKGYEPLVQFTDVPLIELQQKLDEAKGSLEKVEKYLIKVVEQVKSIQTSLARFPSLEFLLQKVVDSNISDLNENMKNLLEKYNFILTTNHSQIVTKAKILKMSTSELSGFKESVTFDMLTVSFVEDQWTLIDNFKQKIQKNLEDFKVSILEELKSIPEKYSIGDLTNRITTLSYDNLEEKQEIDMQYSQLKEKLLSELKSFNELDLDNLDVQSEIKKIVDETVEKVTKINTIYESIQILEKRVRNHFNIYIKQLCSSNLPDELKSKCPDFAYSDIEEFLNDYKSYLQRQKESLKIKAEFFNVPLVTDLIDKYIQGTGTVMFIKLFSDQQIEKHTNELKTLNKKIEAEETRWKTNILSTVSDGIKSEVKAILDSSIDFSVKDERVTRAVDREMERLKQRLRQIEIKVSALESIPNCKYCHFNKVEVPGNVKEFSEKIDKYELNFNSAVDDLKKDMKDSLNFIPSIKEEIEKIVDNFNGTNYQIILKKIYDFITSKSKYNPTDFLFIREVKEYTVSNDLENLITFTKDVFDNNTHIENFFTMLDSVKKKVSENFNVEHLTSLVLAIDTVQTQQKVTSFLEAYKEYISTLLKKLKELSTVMVITDPIPVIQVDNLSIYNLEVEEHSKLLKEFQKKIEEAFYSNLPDCEERKEIKALLESTNLADSTSELENLIKGYIENLSSSFPNVSVNNSNLREMTLTLVSLTKEREELINKLSTEVINKLKDNLTEYKFENSIKILGVDFDKNNIGPFIEEFKKEYISYRNQLLSRRDLISPDTPDTLPSVEQPTLQLFLELVTSGFNKIAKFNESLKTGLERYLVYLNFVCQGCDAEKVCGALKKRLCNSLDNSVIRDVNNFLQDKEKCLKKGICERCFQIIEHLLEGTWEKSGIISSPVLNQQKIKQCTYSMEELKKVWNTLEDLDEIYQKNIDLVITRKGFQVTTSTKSFLDVAKTLGFKYTQPTKWYKSHADITTMISLLGDSNFHKKFLDSHDLGSFTLYLFTSKDSYFILLHVNVNTKQVKEDRYYYLIPTPEPVIYYKKGDEKIEEKNNRTTATNLFLVGVDKALGIKFKDNTCETIMNGGQIKIKYKYI